MTPEDARAKARSTYNAAADTFDDPVNSFWDRFGRRTVERLHLQPGSRVLDVCCGSGASAIPAAEAVGPEGSVIGIDLAEKLLDLAREKAAARDLRQVEFRTGDMLALDFPTAHFDAAICVFGIFFVPDMLAAMRELWRVVRPGGQLAITTWGPRLFEPANTEFWHAVRSVRADLFKTFNPWDRITDPAAVRALFPAAGVERLDIVGEPGWHALRTPEDWWAMVQGTGYRGTIDQLDASSRQKVKELTIGSLDAANIDEVEANVIYAVAVKAGE